MSTHFGPNSFELKQEIIPNPNVNFTATQSGWNVEKNQFGILQLKHPRKSLLNDGVSGKKIKKDFRLFIRRKN